MFNSLQTQYLDGNFLSKAEIRKRLEKMGINMNKKYSSKSKNEKSSLKEDYNLALQNSDNVEKIKKEIEEDKDFMNKERDDSKKDLSKRKFSKENKIISHNEISEKSPLLDNIKNSLKTDLPNSIFTKIPKNNIVKDNLNLINNDIKNEKRTNCKKSFFLGTLIGSISTGGILLSKSNYSNNVINEFKNIDFGSIATFFNNIFHPIKNFYYIFKPTIGSNIIKIFNVIILQINELLYELEKYDSFTLLEIFFIGYIILIIFKFFLNKIQNMFKVKNE
jgi:hypothetical protein